MLEDRRKFARLNSGFNVEYSYSDRICSVDDKTATRNISAGGISFTVSGIIKNNSKLKVRIKIPKIGWVSGICRLIWRKKYDQRSGCKWLAGLKFIKMEAKDRDILAEHICQYFGFLIPKRRWVR